MVFEPASVIPALGRLRQEDPEFHGRVGYTTKPHPFKKKEKYMDFCSQRSTYLILNFVNQFVEKISFLNF
jgi:hypothetical protein